MADDFNPSPLIQTIIDDETLMNHHIHPELKGLIVQGVDALASVIPR
jgi:hypothetical protein